MKPSKKATFLLLTLEIMYEFIAEIKINIYSFWVFINPLFLNIMDLKNDKR